MTYTPYIYNGATWILPNATVEFREPLSNQAIGASCASGYLRSAVYTTIWGYMDAHRAQVLVATGKFVSQDVQSSCVYNLNLFDYDKDIFIIINNDKDIFIMIRSNLYLGFC